MNREWDYLWLLAAGICLLIGRNFTIAGLLAGLAGIAVGSVSYCCRTKRSILVLSAFTIPICLLLPETALFLPLIVYTLWEQRAYWGLASLSVIFPWMRENRTEEWLLLLLVLLGAYLLQKRTQKVTHLTREMIQTKDSGTELTKALKDKNKTLLEKQDSEIYMATLKERNRIAREIHDNVGHMLSRSILQVGALTTIHKEEPLNTQLVSINDSLNHAMNSIRESVHDLHDDSIDLRQAIEEILTAVELSYQVTFDYDMSRIIPKQVKYCLIATVKEAISNVVRHSDATKILVLMREHPAFYQLVVEDNGHAEKKSLEGGIGLQNMRERAEALQGNLLIHQEQGFKIFLSIQKELLEGED